MTDRLCDKYVFAESNGNVLVQSYNIIVHVVVIIIIIVLTNSAPFCVISLALFPSLRIYLMTVLRTISRQSSHSLYGTSSLFRSSAVCQSFPS